MNIVSSSQTTASTSPSSKIATTGSHSYALHSSSKKHIWVIDTRATDHMTFDPRQITSHTPSSQSVMSNANGTSSPVIGEGSLSLSDSLTLDSDILSSKMIGCGTRRGKLYYLDLKFDSEASLSHAYKIGGTSVEKQTSEEHDIYFSAVHEEHRNANTSQISRLFPSELSHTENDRSHTASDRSPEPPPENDWSLEASDRSLETLP
ncbi:unnamed protein product [Prunus armeniaca]